MTKQTEKSTLILGIILSVILHVALLAFIFMGDFNSEIKPLSTASVTKEIKPIEATVIDSAKVKKAIDKIKKQKADEKAAEQKRIENIKKRRQKEEATIKKLEKQRKIKEQEKKRADEAAKLAKIKAAKADKVRKQKEQEKKKAEDAAAKARSKRMKEEAAAKKADELRKKQLAERKRKQKEAAEKAKQEKILAEQMAAEMAAEMATRNKARQQQMMSEIQRYAALITNVIDQNMINDRSTMEGKSCKLLISLAPSGFVKQVRNVSGDAVVCEAARRAVYKAGTLPVSKDPEIFKEMSNIDVIVKPEF